MAKVDICSYSSHGHWLNSREYFMVLLDMEHWFSVFGIILLALTPLLLEGAPQGKVDGNI